MATGLLWSTWWRKVVIWSVLGYSSVEVPTEGPSIVTRCKLFAKYFASCAKYFGVMQNCKIFRCEALINLNFQVISLIWVRVSPNRGRYSIVRLTSVLPLVFISTCLFVGIYLQTDVTFWYAKTCSYLLSPYTLINIDALNSCSAWSRRSAYVWRSCRLHKIAANDTLKKIKTVTVPFISILCVGTI